MKSRAPGTLKNHRSGVMAYLGFCTRLGINPHHTSYQDICAYLEYLAEYISAPATIRNKLSQVRVHLALVGVTTHSLTHPRVIRSLEAMDRDKSYVPRVKDPISPDILRAILMDLHDDPISNIARAAILLLYFGALRQSELLPKSINAWSPHIQPTRNDMQVLNDRCLLYIKTGKNMQKTGQHRRIVLAATDDPYLCPVRAMLRVLSDTPTSSPLNPLLMFYDTRKPVPSSLILKIFHAKLRHLGFPHLTHKLSLHSLRKAAATDAFTGGCSELSIKRYGAWSSSAYTSYINTSNNHVNSTLITSLSKPPS